MKCHTNHLFFFRDEKESTVQHRLTHSFPSPRVIRGPPLAIPLSHVVRLPPAHAEEAAAVARRENANLT